MVGIREKYSTKRKSIIKDEFVTFRNSSDEVLHSFDRPIIERVMKRKGGRQQTRLSLSMLSIMGLFAPFLSSSEDGRLNAVGSVYQSNFQQMYQNSQYFQRNTSASGINVNTPDNEKSYEEIMQEGRNEEGIISEEERREIERPKTVEEILNARSLYDKYLAWVESRRSRGKTYPTWEEYLAAVEGS